MTSTNIFSFKRIFLLTLATTLFLTAQTAFAADRYWVGATTDFHSSSNWSTTDGGAGGASVPGASDVAIFTSSDTTDSDITSNITLDGMTIQSGYTGTITNASDVDITFTGPFTQNDGTFYTGDGGGTNTDHQATTTLNGGTYDAGTDDAFVQSAGDLVIDGGTFDASNATSILIETNSNTALNFDSGSLSAPGTLQILGGWDQEAGTTFTHNNGIVSFTDNNPSTSFDLDNDAGTSFYDFRVEKDLASSVLVLQSDLDVDNDFAIIDGEFQAGSNTITVGNDYGLVGGTFTANTSTFVMDGTDQDITAGSTTFYNFQKAVTSAATLTLPQGQTQTFTNALTLTGTSGNYLSLRSSLSAFQANIAPTGSRTIQYVDVQDSNNTSGTDIDVIGDNVINSGNNTNWVFTGPAVPEFSTYMYLLCFLMGGYLIWKKSTSPQIQ